MKIILVSFMATVIFLFSQSKDSYFEEANKLYEEKAYRKAELIYQKLLKEHPNNYKIIYNLANTHYALAQQKIRQREKKKKISPYRFFFSKKLWLIIKLIARHIIA